LLQSLALICNFKATSDLPQWLSKKEREGLRAFLEKYPTIEQLDRYRFKVDGQQIDFGSALPLPKVPLGWTAIQSNLFGWMANHEWALKIYDDTNKKAWEKMKKELK